MFKEKQYLFIPGPTPVPPAVVRAMTRPIVGHRSNDFAQLNKRVVDKLKQVFQTENDLFVLGNSGTGAMETAILNTINPGDPVLALITGHFGERFAKLAVTYGAEVDRLDFPWGESIDLNAVEKALQDKAYKAVLVTHNETSTGVVNDLTGLGKLVAKTEALLMVDAVSSLAGIEVKTDRDHLDLVVTASQKALMLPPGLAAISVSAKAWQRAEACQNAKFYFSLAEYKKAMAKNHTPWTPAVSLFYGLEEALDLILAEGLAQVFARHQRLAKAVRIGVKALGLEVVAPETCASPTVTAIRMPAGVDADQLRKFAGQKLGIVFAGGKGQLAGKVIRFGHMGFVGEFDIITGLAAIEMGLAHFGYQVKKPGVGVGKAQEYLLDTLP
ncbi:MAG: pyridoxal-phosphate-dependent aminotransferase family protein [bacterium]|jgi:aspartate aminotransferase-like enzyme